MTYSLNRRHFIRLAGLGTAGISALGAGLGPRSAEQDSTTGPAPSPGPSRPRPPAKAPDGPNVIVIMTDQQRADVCRREGFPLDTTPFLDSLGAQGLWFNRAYTSCPACVPARTSFLTGRFPAAAHVRCNHNLPDAYFTKDLFEVMRDQGYKTALFGKNHSYLKPEMCEYWSNYDHLGRPAKDEQDESFNAFLKSTSFHSSMAPCPFPASVQNPARMVDDAQQWIEGLEGHPFFVWFSIPEPHNPYQVPEPYYSLFPPEELPPTVAGPDEVKVKSEQFHLYDKLIHMGMPHLAEQLPRMRANYFGMLHLIDDQLKRLVEFLEQKGLREKTVIVFVSDHGDFVGEFGWMRKGPGLPEILTRVPMIWAGPGIGTGSADPHPAHVSMVDIFPTLCEAVGAPIPDGVQGRSLWPMLTGKPYPEDEFESVYVEAGYGGLQVRSFTNPTPQEEGAVSPPAGFDELNSWTQSGTRRMVRKGDWKLIFDMDGNGQLYHLAPDPAELRNLFGDPSAREMEEDLMRELMKWTLRAQDPLPYPQRRYVMRIPPHGWRETVDGQPA